MPGVDSVAGASVPWNLGWFRRDILSPCKILGGWI